MSIRLVVISNNLILCCPLLLLPSVFPSIRVFSSESALHIRWPKYWSFSFGISPSNKSSGLISFRIDWFDLLPSLLLHFKLEFYCKEELFLFSFFFNYLLILVWIDGFFLYSVVYSLLLSSFFFFFLVQIWPENPLRLASISFWCVPIICLKYLTSRPQIVCSRPILCFCCSAMTWAVIPRSPGFFSWRLVFRNQDLGSMCTYCCWSISVSSCSLWRELEIYEHTHTSVFICIFVFLHIYNKIITS